MAVILTKRKLTNNWSDKCWEKLSGLCTWSSGMSLGYRTLYYNAQKLFAKLKMTKADGSYAKEISRIEKQDLLIIYDFGLVHLDNTARMIQMEIIEDRHGRKSTIIASQLPVAQWYEVIGESTVADAILDRMVHTAHRMDLKGQSIRKK